MKSHFIKQYFFLSADDAMYISDLIVYDVPFHKRIEASKDEKEVI